MIWRETGKGQERSRHFIATALHVHKAEQTGSELIDIAERQKPRRIRGQTSEGSKTSPGAPSGQVVASAKTEDLAKEASRRLPSSPKLEGRHEMVLRYILDKIGPRINTHAPFRRHSQ